MEKEKKVFCERCSKELSSIAIVWLELSQTDGNYYRATEFPANHISQGFFPFGNACAHAENIERLSKEDKK